MSLETPLLALFKEQLEAECSTLASTHGLSKRGDSLIYWYFIHLHDFSDADVEEIVCDGGGDLGIDAIWIDDDELVHFYSFKNPADASHGFPSGDVDKTISGLKVIIEKKHEQIANPELKARLSEVYQQVPKGYRIHFVTSGQGFIEEAIVKLDAFVESLRMPSTNLFSWDIQSLDRLQDQFYQQSLPAVNEPLRFDLPTPPYMLISGLAECYLFHVDGGTLVDLYNAHGEGLLQRNIRVDQRYTATNRSIEATCIGGESSNFLHFNNGVTFLCDSASYDNFKRTLTLQRAQVVNGGQTIRALHRAGDKGLLRSDVLVPARAITSSGDKNFANNVAVNLNNQNQLGTGFLRSNDQRIVQLDYALSSLGWYLERREGELKSATEEEIAAIEVRIGDKITGHTIHLKEGAQAYTATFFQQPEIAKKNPKKMFQSVDEGGFYERIFSIEMTAEKIIVAHKIKVFVDDFVRKFATVRRKALAYGDDSTAYDSVLGEELANRHRDVIHQVIPQCSLFLCGTIFKDLVELRKLGYHNIPDFLQQDGSRLIQEHLVDIIDFAKSNRDKADKSWHVLFKSNSFFSDITIYLAGIHRGVNGSSRRS